MTPRNNHPLPPDFNHRLHRAAEALWRAFDYELPADPYTVARIALDAADDEEWTP